MPSDRPNPIRPGSPCPESGGQTFESFVFFIGELSTPTANRSFSHELARCTACGVALRGVNADPWTRMTHPEFERAVADHRERGRRLREQLRPPVPKPSTQGQ